MAIIADSVKLIFNPTSGSVDRDGSVNYKAIWRLQVDTPHDQVQTIVLWWQLNMFPLGSMYNLANDAQGSLATCKNIAPTPVPNTNDYWLVTVTYSKEDDDSKQDEDDNLTTDPLEYRIQVRASSSSITKPGKELYFVSLYSDYSFRIRQKIPSGFDPPIATMPVNSNLKPFEPFPEIDDFHWWISIEKNVATFDGNLAYVTYLNKEENLSFSYKGLTIGPKSFWQCKIRDCELEFTRENSVDFWKVRYYVEIKPAEERFWHVLPDLGWESLALDGDDDLHGSAVGQGAGLTPVVDGRPRHIGMVDPHGHPVRSLVPLDGDGHAADVTATPFVPKKSTWWEGKEVEFSTVPVLKEVFSAE